jgi:two-component system, OmpR family, sensor kinase
MTIKARLIITISLLVAVAFVVSGIVTVNRTRAGLIERVDEMIVTVPLRQPRVGSGEPHAGPGRESVATIVVAANGSVIYASPSGLASDPDPLPDLSSVDPRELHARSGAFVTVGATGESNLQYRVLIRPLDNGWFLAIAAPLDSVEATVQHVTMIIVATNVAVFASLLLIVWLTIRRGLRPIDNMIDTAALIAAGDLSHRAESADPATEVGQLATALNAMLNRIEASFAAKDVSERRLRQFVADASHELRTPLTSIRGYAELYRTGAVSDGDALDRAMERIESEGIRMGKLVEDLLLLARLDQGRPLESKAVDVSRVVSDAVADARAIEPERPISYQSADGALMLGDADRLRQVVGNLLTNARAHTGRSTPVHVVVRTIPTGVELTVADEGPGIDPDQAAHVFDRFYRVDASRSRDRGGSGLGLSIVKSIVEAHGGEVALETEPGKGTTFRVTLPRMTEGMPDETRPRTARDGAPASRRDRVAVRG